MQTDYIPSKSIVFLLLLTYSVLQVHAQRFHWAKHFKTSPTSVFYAWANAVASGSNGEVFLAGYFNENLDVDGQLLITDTGQDGFLVKLDSTGNVLWANALGASVSGNVSYIESDVNGNLIVVGWYLGALTMGTETLTTTDSRGEYFVAKYSSSGQFLWVKPFYNALYPALDIYGNIYFINPIPYSSLGFSNEFLVKLDGSGNVVYSSLIYHRTTTTYFGPSQTTPDQFGNVYLSGLATDGALIGAISFSADLTGFVIVKCNAQGIPVSVRKVADIPASGAWVLGKMITDGAGNLYHSIYADEMSLIKYDSAGKVVWSLRNDQINISFRGLQIDSRGNLYAAGNFQGNFNLGQSKFISPPGTQSTFLAKFSYSGVIQWHLQGQNEFWDHITDLARDPDTGNLYMSGSLQSTAASFGETILSGSKLEHSALILKAKDKTVDQLLALNLGNDTTLCPGSSITLSAPGFARYTWQDSTHNSIFYVTTPGTYYLTAIDFLGRMYTDSLIVTLCTNPSEGIEPPASSESPEEAKVSPSTGQQDIPVLPVLIFPNVITPNNDPFNECFFIENLDVSKPNFLVVFDRWGKEIYSTHQYQNNWDGWQTQGGVYFYKFVDGRNRNKHKGMLQVLKQD